MSERDNDVTTEGEFISLEGPDVETSSTEPAPELDAAALYEQDQLRSVRTVEEGENR